MSTSAFKHDIMRGVVAFFVIANCVTYRQLLNDTISALWNTTFGSEFGTFAQVMASIGLIIIVCGVLAIFNLVTGAVGLMTTIVQLAGVVAVYLFVSDSHFQLTIIAILAIYYGSNMSESLDKLQQKFTKNVQFARAHDDAIRTQTAGGYDQAIKADK